MDWITWVIVALVILWLVGKAQPSKSNRKSKSLGNVKVEAQEIAENIKTIAQFNALERRLEKAEERLTDVETERAYDNACHKCEVLQDAINIAESKTYLWQFIPDIDLHTPKSVLTHAYKAYKPDEYEQVKATLGNDHGEWLDIDAYGEKEDPDDDLKPLIKFRDIVETNLSQDEKIKKINQLFKRSKELSDLYIVEEDLTPGEQWFAEQMSDDGLPLAYELYSEGFTTPEKCLEIDLDEFAIRTGVGPKKLAQLKEYQEKVVRRQQDA